MIDRFAVHTPALTPLKAGDKIFKAPLTLDFAPSCVNVMFGHNGAGKSSVLRLIARMMFCEQAGFQIITDRGIRYASCYENKDLLGDTRPVTAWGEVISDGGPVWYLHGEATPGLLYGGGEFDYDVSFENITKPTMRGRRELSKGNYYIEMLDKTLAEIRTYQDPASPPYKWKGEKRPTPKGYDASDPHARYQLRHYERQAIDAFDHATSALKTDNMKSPVLLVDEPETHLALMRQFALFDDLLTLTQHPTKPLQVIMASHSPLVFSYPSNESFASDPRCIRFVDLSPAMKSERHAAKEMLLDRFMVRAFRS